MSEPPKSEQSKFARHSNLENFDPEDFENFLGHAPVLGLQEDKDEYDQISHRMLEDIRPSNFIEQMFVIDLIDQIFEIINIRRLVVACKALAEGRGIEASLTRGILSDAPPGAEKMAHIDAKVQAKRWRDDESSRDSIEARIYALGVTDEEMQLDVFFQSLPTLELLEKRLFATQQRHKALLREIAGHREIARRARQVSDRVIEHAAKLELKPEA